MEPAELKSILSALILPPGGPLLLALFGLLLAALRWRRVGILMAFLGVGIALALTLNGVTLWLADHLLDQSPPARLEQVKGVQAIVVLGGGVYPVAEEYGAAQPSANTLARVRYGAWLARRTGLPLSFAGGQGWSVTGTSAASEGQVVARVLKEDFGLALRWNDDQSRDTRENAENIAKLLKRDGIRRIALVTEAWHMPRSVGHFRAQGLEVLPAPTRFLTWRERPLLEWLPSIHALVGSREVLREWLGMRVVPPDPPAAP
jgi:uncharacterized SAM-binding protein YcdF (DUF218 family)